ncbi:MAG TPA: FHA domain-containing protein [Streptosporangiaceae bacterium]|nr:FHA domain-containing protein [Streptosporangiaceae bacterium]
MSERGEAARRPARAPRSRRSRKRWLVAAGVTVGWLVLLDVTGSVIAASMLLAFLAGLGVVGVLILRALGMTRDHPWVQQLAARPWRDGQDVLHLALRHLAEVFIVTPSGSLLAPNFIELRLNPADLSALTERMDLSLISESAAEVYVEQVAAHGARFAGYGPADVRVLADPAVPPGRYRLRQAQPVDGYQPGLAYAGAAVPAAPGAGPAGFIPPGGGGYMPPGPELARTAPRPAAASPGAAADSGSGMSSPGAQAGPVVPPAPYRGFAGHDGNTRPGPGQPGEPERPAPASGPGPRTVTDLPTVIELSRGPAPVLRLRTGDAVAETRVSGARAGRGAVELSLPDVPTVSREHARFTFSDGQWWIANLGRNGLCLNGAALVGEQPLSNGDSIRWGMRPDAPLSRVELG